LFSAPSGKGKGGNQGGKQVVGNLQLPNNLKLAPGTTLKISIQ
jgi:hypothetical protein